MGGVLWANTDSASKIAEVIVSEVYMFDRDFLDYASEGNLKAIKATLAYAPENAAALLNATDANGDTPLMLAAWLGHVAVVEHLASANHNGATAYLLAAAGGHTKVMRILAATRGVNTNVSDKNGADALTLLRRAMERQTLQNPFSFTPQQQQALNRRRASHPSAHLG